MHVACPHCNQALEVPDSLAGQVARCGSCSTLFTAPRPDGGAMPAPPPSQAWPWPSTPGYATAQGGTYGSVPGTRPGATRGQPADPFPPPSYAQADGVADAQRVHGQLGVLGGFMIGLGVLVLLWTGILVLGVVMPEEVLRESPTYRPGSRDPRTVTAMSVMAVLSGATGVYQFMAGIVLIRKRLRARTSGIVAAALSLASLWTGCLWLFGLGLGIYALVVLVPNKPA